MTFFVRICVFTFAFCIAACTLFADEIYCYAAASLTDALTEAGKHFEAKSGSRVFFNFGASSTLARQIESGAPADLFFSADEQKMDELQSQDLLLKGTRKSILSNTLVVVTSVNLKLPLGSVEELVKKSGRIALAEYNSVPAGMYARDYFTKLALWEQIRTRVVPVQNVRAALFAVESENVEFAIVFKTDAQISKRVHVAYEITKEEGPDISYPIAILKQSKNVQLAEKFYKFLTDPAGLEIFRKYGFNTRSEQSSVPYK